MAIPSIPRCEVGRRSVASHSLNGSSNHVLTAIPRSYGKGKIATPYKIKIPERIGVQESLALARKPHDAEAVLFGLKFADNIHH